MTIIMWTSKKVILLSMFQTVFLFMAGLIAPAAAEPFRTVVEIESGALEGAVANDILAFKSVPYAKPPVRERRWRPPEPETWSGVRPAKEFGSECPQLFFQLSSLAWKFKGAEDCLFLNVWRPAQQNTAIEPLPVLVWIHGGGNVMGGSTDAGLNPNRAPVADGSAMARQGLVIVSLNYRLGRLGFFAHPALITAAGGPASYSGNFGLMDQIRALEWVRTNIGKFGGDPRQVTVMGESAGGINILHLMTSPKARGLFHRAIIMSGAGRDSLLLRPMTGGTAARPSADMIGLNFARSVDIQGNGADAVASLRDLAPIKFMTGLDFVSLVLKVQHDDPQSGLVMIDGSIVTAAPVAILCRGGIAPVPVMIGTVADDLPVRFPPRVEPYPYAYFGTSQQQKEAKQVYHGNAAAAEKKVGVDISMHEPARFIAAKSTTASGHGAWLYRFTYVSDAEPASARQKGAQHSGELPFAFQTLDRRYPGPLSTSDRKLEHAFSTYIIQFVKSREADPNGNGLQGWPKFDAAERKLMDFNDQGPTFSLDPLHQRMELVEKVARCP